MKLIQPLSLVGGDAQFGMVQLARSTPPRGCIVEVGVYQGGTAWQLAIVARERDVPLYLFDTFTGIPMQGEDDPHKVGDFGDVDEAAVRAALPDAIITKGVFPETSFDMFPISFAHIDTDQYQSIKDCIDTLYPMMVIGGVMLFDDYGHLAGATRAVEESFSSGVEFTNQHKAFVRVGEATRIL